MFKVFFISLHNVQMVFQLLLTKQAFLHNYKVTIYLIKILFIWDLKNPILFLNKCKQSTLTPTKFYRNQSDQNISFKFTTHTILPNFNLHRALYLGMHGLLVKFYRLNKDLARMKDVYRDAVDGNLPMNQADKIKARFTSGLLKIN